MTSSVKFEFKSFNILYKTDNLFCTFIKKLHIIINFQTQMPLLLLMENSLGFLTFAQTGRPLCVLVWSFPPFPYQVYLTNRKLRHLKMRLQRPETSVSQLNTFMFCQINSYVFIQGIKNQPLYQQRWPAGLVRRRICSFPDDHKPLPSLPMWWWLLCNLS